MLMLIQGNVYMQLLTKEKWDPASRYLMKHWSTRHTHKEKKKNHKRLTQKQALGTREHSQELAVHKRERGKSSGQVF